MPPNELEKWNARYVPQYNIEGQCKLNECYYYETPPSSDFIMAQAQFLAAVAETSYVEPIESQSCDPYNSDTQDFSSQPKPFGSMPEITDNRQVPVLLPSCLDTPLKKKSLAPIQLHNNHVQGKLQPVDSLQLVPLQKPEKLAPLQPLNDVLAKPLQRQGTFKPLAPLDVLSPKVKSSKKKGTKKEMEKKVSRDAKNG